LFAAAAAAMTAVAAAATTAALFIFVHFVSSIYLHPIGHDLMRESLWTPYA